MTQSFDYWVWLNAIKTTLALNNKLDPTDSVNRYISQVLAQSFVPGPPFPIILIVPSSKSIDQQVQIGYNPYVTFIVQIRIYCSVPNMSPTSAMLSALSLSEIATGEESMQELSLITKEVESWLRGDETADGQNRRKLFLQDDSNYSFGVTQMGPVAFSEEKLGDARLNRTTLSLFIPKVRLLTT